MNSERDDRPTPLDAALREVFASEMAGFCPRPEELAALVAGKLSEAEEEDLLARVADHPEAMENLLALRALARDAGPTPRPTELPPEIAAGVAKTLAGLRFEAPPAGGTAPFPSRVDPPSRRRVWSNGYAWAALAALFLWGLGAAFWQEWQEGRRLANELAASQNALLASQEQTRQLESQIAALRVAPAPVAGLPILDLFPAGRLRSAPGVIDSTGARTAAGSPQVPGDRATVLILTPNDPKPRRRYLLTLETATTQRWQNTVEADAAGVVVFWLPGHFLEPGDYRLRLRPADGGTVDTFAFSVVAP